MGFWFRSYLNDLVVFPVFFSLSLMSFAMSSWSEPQSAPSLVFADLELLYLQLQRVWSIWFQYWFSGDVHVQSRLLCCWKRLFAMTSAFFWQNAISLCLASFVLQGQICLVSQVSLNFLFLHSSSLWWKGKLFFFPVIFLGSWLVF